MVQKTNLDGKLDINLDIKLLCEINIIFNRPGVAGAVLQTAS